MKLIEPQVSVLDRSNQLKLCEYVGRICYRSEDAITDQSYINFLKKITSLHHYSIIEHARYSFKLTGNVPKRVYAKLGNLPGVYLKQSSNVLYVSINLRNAIELAGDPLYTGFLKAILQLDDHVSKIIPDELVNVEVKKQPYSITPYKPKSDDDDFNFYSFEFFIPRGIWDELARHRDNSCACESSRYCCYSKEKFNKQLKILKPIWFNKSSWLVKTVWKFQMTLLEKLYLFLSKYLQAQEVRGMLPLDYCVKCSVTANKTQWMHIIKLRSSPAAHPEMVNVIKRVEELLKDQCGCSVNEGD